MFRFHHFRYYHNILCSWSLKKKGIVLLYWLLLKVFRAVSIILIFASTSNDLGISMQEITNYSISDLIIRQSIYTLAALLLYFSILFAKKTFLVLIFLIGFFSYHLYYFIKTFWINGNYLFLILEIIWLVIFGYLGMLVIQELMLKDKQQSAL